MKRKHTSTESIDGEGSLVKHPKKERTMQEQLLKEFLMHFEIGKVADLVEVIIDYLEETHVLLKVEFNPWSEAYLLPENCETAEFLKQLREWSYATGDPCLRDEPIGKELIKSNKWEKFLIGNSSLINATRITETISLWFVEE
jgi:hypothetical protein